MSWSHLCKGTTCTLSRPGKAGLQWTISIAAIQNAPPHHADKFVWDSRAPPRVQFFVWLLIHGRVQCRVNLCLKSIVDSPICAVCNQETETGEHIVFDCPFAQEFWQQLGFHISRMGSVDRLISVPCPTTFPEQHFTTFMALCYWHLWKRRNGVVFREEAATISVGV